MKTISQEYDEMAARLDAEAERRRTAALEDARSNDERLILAEYARAGLVPLCSRGGMLVTLPLARKMGLRLRKVEDDSSGVSSDR